MARNIADTINPKTRLAVSIILLLSTFISLMSQTMMITALPVIQNQMNQSLTTVQWLTTGYTLLIGIVTPLSSNMYDKFSNRSVFLGTIGTFVIGTLIGCLATNFWLLLLARLVQACAGGILMSFQMTTMISIYPPEKRGTIIGMSGLVIAFGPAIGPTLAGFILNLLGWRYLFILILPIMVLIWIIGYFVFPNYSEPLDIKIDYLSVVLSLLGSSLALIGITIVQTQWMLGLAMLVVGAIILYFFVKRQLNLKQPMLNVRIIKLYSFRMMVLVGICAFMVLLGMEQMVSIYAQNVSHVSSMTAGMILLPGAIANALTASVVGRAYDQYGAKWLVISGGILMLVSAIPFVIISKGTPIWIMTVFYMIRMVGNALVFSPAISESFRGVAPREISHATALNNTLRQVSGAVSVTMLIVISSIPHSFVLGMRISMWVTVVLVLLMLAVFISYIKNRNSRR